MRSTPVVRGDGPRRMTARSATVLRIDAAALDAPRPQRSAAVRRCRCAAFARADGCPGVSGRARSRHWTTTASRRRPPARRWCLPPGRRCAATAPSADGSEVTLTGHQAYPPTRDGRSGRPPRAASTNSAHNSLSVTWARFARAYWSVPLYASASISSSATAQRRCVHATRRHRQHTSRLAPAVAARAARSSAGTARPLGRRRSPRCRRRSFAAWGGGRRRCGSPRRDGRNGRVARRQRDGRRRARSRSATRLCTAPFCAAAAISSADQLGLVGITSVNDHRGAAACQQLAGRPTEARSRPCDEDHATAELVLGQICPALQSRAHAVADAA